MSPSPSHTLPGCPPSHADTDPGLEASLGGCTFSHGPLICSANSPKCPWCALTLSWVWGWKQETGVRGPAPGAVSTSRPSTVAQSRTWLLRGRCEIHTGHKGPWSPRVWSWSPRVWKVVFALSVWLCAERWITGLQHGMEVNRAPSVSFLTWPLAR